MTQQDAKNLKNGLYRIFWKNDESNSLAAIGRLHDGRVWLAPCNWTSSTEYGIASIHSWDMVECVERIG